MIFNIYHPIQKKLRTAPEIFQMHLQKEMNIRRMKLRGRMR